MERDPLAFLDKIAQDYSRLVRVRFAVITATAAIHPHAVEHVLQKNHTNYSKELFDYKILRRALGRGLLTNDGPDWLRQRRMIQPAFQKSRLEQYRTLMSRAVQEMLDRWSALPDAIVDVGVEMHRLTLRIVGEALFSLDLTGDAVVFGEALNRTNELLAKRFFSKAPPFVPIPNDLRLAFAVRRLRGVVDQMIAGRRSNPEDQDDLLSRLMRARDERGAMSARQLRDEILTLVAAGHETTATALAWTLVELAAHPLERERLEQECQKPTETLPDGVSRTRAVIQESMRLHPPAWIFSRKAIQEDEIMGHRIPGGSMVLISPWLTQRHPAFWENARAFQPDRFIGKQRGTDYRYFPFGGGPRLCVGADFAMAEAEIVLGAIVSRFRLEPLFSFPVRSRPMITLQPAGPLHFRLHPL